AATAARTGWSAGSAGPSSSTTYASSPAPPPAAPPHEHAPASDHPRRRPRRRHPPHARFAPETSLGPYRRQWRTATTPYTRRCSIVMGHLVTSGEQRQRHIGGAAPSLWAILSPVANSDNATSTALLQRQDRPVASRIERQRKLPVVVRIKQLTLLLSRS